MGTSFFLPFFTCLIATPLARRAARSGAVPRLAPSDLPRLLARLAKRSAARGAQLGVLAVLAVPIPLLLALPHEAMTRREVVVFKVVFTAVLGALVTPLVCCRALADPDRA